MADTPEARIADLYVLPPDEFIGGRAALVKELKADGDKQAASEVGRLRKPTIVAWALNQLVRVDAEGLDEFGRAVDHLRAAQDKALAGDRTVDLRSAVNERREWSARLLQSASRALREADRDAEPHLAAMGATIEAAAADPEVGELLRSGRLSTERSAPGFDAGAWAVPVPASASARPAEPTRPVSDKPRVDRALPEQTPKQDQQAKAAAARELKSAERRLKSAEADLDAARRKVEKLDAELRRARRTFTDLDRAAQSVRKEVETARRRAGGV